VRAARRLLIALHGLSDDCTINLNQWRQPQRRDWSTTSCGSARISSWAMDKADAHPPNRRIPNRLLLLD
jgi:hypothetical protein